MAGQPLAHGERDMPGREHDRACDTLDRAARHGASTRATEDVGVRQAPSHGTTIAIRVLCHDKGPVIEKKNSKIKYNFYFCFVACF